MSDWEKMQEYGIQETKSWPIGTKIRLRLMGGKFSGEIIEIQSPAGLLSPRYKCRLDTGEITGFIYSSDMIRD